MAPISTSPSDPRRGFHPDWRTFLFDYAKPQVVSYLVSSARYWLEEFHVDGLRVDAVASMLYHDFARRAGEWLPNEEGGRENLEAVAFLKQLNDVLHREHPGVLTFAEESTQWKGVTAPVKEGGLGFDYKWNMGWMNDTLAYARLDPVLRKKHHEDLTFSMTYAFDESFLLPLSHDEVVHGKASLLSKTPGPHRMHFAHLRAVLGYQFAHPGKKLLFMGAELGQWSEWDHDSQLEWELLEYEEHRRLRHYVRGLNGLYRARPALHEVENRWDGFEWVEPGDDARSLLSFLRKGESGTLLVLINFAPVPWKDYRVGVPEAGSWIPVFNSDDAKFGGSGVKLPLKIVATEATSHDRDHSITLTVPPLSAVFLEPAPQLA